MGPYLSGSDPSPDTSPLRLEPIEDVLPGRISRAFVFYGQRDLHLDARIEGVDRELGFFLPKALSTPSRSDGLDGNRTISEATIHDMEILGLVCDIGGSTEHRNEEERAFLRSPGL